MASGRVIGGRIVASLCASLDVPARGSSSTHYGHNAPIAFSFASAAWSTVWQSIPSCLPKLPLRQGTPGGIACSAALLVGSAPFTHTNVYNSPRSLKIPPHSPSVSLSRWLGIHRAVMLRSIGVGWQPVFLRRGEPPTFLLLTAPA
jgi:hypothetical protein